MPRFVYLVGEVRCPQRKVVTVAGWVFAENLQPFAELLAFLAGYTLYDEEYDGDALEYVARRCLSGRCWHGNCRLRSTTPAQSTSAIAGNAARRAQCTLSPRDTRWITASCTPPTPGAGRGR